MSKYLVLINFKNCDIGRYIVQSYESKKVF